VLDGLRRGANRRLLDPSCGTNIKAIGGALCAMGKRLNLGFDQAP